MFSQPYDISSSFFPFSPPAFHQDSLHDIFIPAAPVPVSSGRRRPMRKDRHSKICTAKGLRDRRMRLSLDVARKFFDLQDLLGFDKASKTVQWLLNKSKAAIKELVSTASDNKGKSTSAILASEFEKNAKPMVQPKLVGREAREKARARARERTMEKKMMRFGRAEDGGKDNQQANILMSIPLGGFLQEEYSSSYELKSSLDIVAEIEEHCSTSPLFQEQWDHTSGYMDEKVVFGEVLLQNGYGRGISMP